MMRVVVFFTRGVSLQAWDKTGMFDREVALYKELQKRGVSVSLLTYGDKVDLAYGSRLPGMRVLCNRWGLRSDAYERWLTWLHWRELSRVDLYKTNQVAGADVALWTARRWEKPVIVRCGYMPSDLAASGGEARKAEAERARKLEYTVLRAAAHVVVTTDANKLYVNSNYGIPLPGVSTIPNYVLTEHFKPDDGQRKERTVLFVGRLEREKNPLAVVDACRGLNVDLRIVGHGPLRSAVMEMARYWGVDIEIMPRVPNAQLSDAMNQATLFVLASPHEGHPKTLIEAMSCGMPVIGANSPGIRELIRHGETGWLCGTDAESIREAIKHLLNNPALCRRMGANARRYAVEHFALERIVPMEIDLYKQVLSRWNSSDVVKVQVEAD